MLKIFVSGRMAPRQASTLEGALLNKRDVKLVLMEVVRYLAHPKSREWFGHVSFQPTRIPRLMFSEANLLRLYGRTSVRTSVRRLLGG